MFANKIFMQKFLINKIKYNEMILSNENVMNIVAAVRLMIRFILWISIAA